MATFIPNARQQFTDANGVPLAGGSVGMYVPSTLTPSATWQDAGQTTLNPNPIPLDMGGFATIYGGGSYRQIVKDALGNTVFDRVVADSLLPNFMQAGAGAKSRTQQDKLRDTVNAKDYTSINAALAAVTANGGGTIIVSDTQAFSTPFTIPLNTSIRCVDGGLLQWTGSTTGTLIGTDSTDVYHNKHNVLRIDSGSHNAEIVRVHSSYGCDFDIHLTGASSSTTSTLLNVTADSTGGGDNIGFRHVALCRFHVTGEGTVGTVLSISGLSPSGSTYLGGAQVVTLNDFNNVYCHNAYVRGIDVRNWCDNNTWSGFTRVGLSSANNGIGFDFGSAGIAAGGDGVYANTVVDLAVDTFDATYTGRKALIFRAGTKANQVYMFHMDPENGTVPVTVEAGVLSYSVKRLKSGTGTVLRESQGEISTGWVTLAQDTATSIDLTGGAGNERAGFLRIASNALEGSLTAWVRAGFSYNVSPVWQGNAGLQVLSAGTGTLTGTTGGINRLNVKVSSDGKIYVENRFAYTIQVALSVDNVTGA